MWNILLLVYLFYIVLCKSNTIINDFHHLEERQAAATSLSVDSICQRKYLNRSYFCRENYTKGYDLICSSLYCFDAIYFQTCQLEPITPQDGTLCGNGKWCEAQSCVTNSNALATSDSCPLGDSRKPSIIFGLNCTEIVAKRPNLCQFAFVNQTWCCDGCAKRNRTDPATFIGPARSAPEDCREIFGPSSYFCQETGPTDFLRICSSMKCFNPNTSQCEEIIPENGVPCGNGKWCVEGHCISSLAAPVDPIADCMYGNQYAAFCQITAVYPNVAKFCSQHEQGCCETCYKHKNTSALGCEYGDRSPDICLSFVVNESIKSYCHGDESDCCETCQKFKSADKPSCPFGDVSTSVCEALMNDTIGPGNCYSLTQSQKCCDTCPKYYNASHTGCEYGDHWKKYCAEHVVPPNVASVCNLYTTQCCGTCGKFEESGHSGCKYGDYDPVACATLMKSANGTSSCYDPAQQTKCCASCDKLKNTSTPACQYGDHKPVYCQQLLNNSRGISNCYDVRTLEIDCCRSCAYLANNTRKDCKYGDKDPQKCRFLIADASSAARLCPTQGMYCCESCSKLGYPGPYGAIVG